MNLPQATPSSTFVSSELPVPTSSPLPRSTSLALLRPSSSSLSDQVRSTCPLDAGVWFGWPKAPPICSSHYYRSAATVGHLGHRRWHNAMFELERNPFWAFPATPMDHLVDDEHEKDRPRSSLFCPKQTNTVSLSLMTKSVSLGLIGV